MDVTTLLVIIAIILLPKWRLVWPWMLGDGLVLSVARSEAKTFDLVQEQRATFSAEHRHAIDQPTATSLSALAVQI
jgi:hypothetical protein